MKLLKKLVSNQISKISKINNILVKNRKEKNQIIIIIVIITEMITENSENRYML